MSTDTTSTRTRRALLTAALGAGAATVASAIGRPLPARAASGIFDSAAANNPAVWASNSASGSPAYGVYGESASTSGSGVSGFVSASSGPVFGVVGQVGSPDGRAVYGINTATSGTATGVAGRSFSTDGLGVLGYASAGSGETFGVNGAVASTQGTGVFGEASAVSGETRGVLGKVASPSGTGIQGYNGTSVLPTPSPRTGVYGYAGQSGSAIGVKGGSSIGLGVVGSSSSNTGIRGESSAASKPAILGLAAGGNTGVQGYSGLGSAPAAPAHTGVYGYAVQDANARGVTGQSIAGRGVNGVATSGVGVYASATTGYALRAVGRVKLDKSAGVATIASGTKSIVVTPGIDVTTSSVVFLSPKADIGTRNLWYTTSTTGDTFTIKVSSASVTDLQVGWLLLG